MNVPPDRIRGCNAQEVSGSGDFVLYWMTAFRRRRYNFALQRAVWWAAELRKPLLVVEGLQRRYPWASARFHAFLLRGMRDNLRDFQGSAALYYPFAETPGTPACGMIRSLASRACVVVTDDFPAFEIPSWIRAAAAPSPVLVEKVDANGLLPVRAGAVFRTAHAFRRFLHRNLPAQLDALPQCDPLEGLDLPGVKLPPAFRQRWPALSARELDSAETMAAGLVEDSEARPVSGVSGGPAAARRRLRDFLERLESYDAARNDPDADAGSGLSPYLHFGHIGSHEIFAGIAANERWTTARIRARAAGSRAGWWGMSPGAEAFLDQTVTWRELGFNACAQRPDYDRYDSLPDWARRTLELHAADRRPFLYTLEQFEGAATHDRLWNAAQAQLRQEGRIHNYLRMLWGKKILEWSASPEQALEIMIHLNNKYALDGRDPNSYTGIFWTLGRYDRPWGPERPVFGTVRYMSSENAARKLHLRSYLARYGGTAA
jgi:deoxyribodipyrimidine photo-lyase